MKNIHKQFIGIAGIMLILLSLVISSISLGWSLFSKIILYLGILLFGGYIIIDFSNIKRFFLKRSSRYGSNALLSTLFVLLILALVNFIFNKRNYRVDLTSSKSFSLSNQTVKVLENLDKDVIITAFFKSNNQTKMNDLLNEYKYHSDKIKFSFVDPDKKPNIAKNYEIEAYGTTVLECEDRMEKIEDTSEEALTNTLIKVTREVKKVLYFMEGHGEHDIDDAERTGYSNIKSMLAEENYQIKKIFLAREGQIPKDCAVLIVNGPKQEPFKSELDTIDSYIEKGGKVFFLLDPQPAPQMEEFFDKYGIEIGNDVIIDLSGIGRLFGTGPEVPLVNKYSSHPIVKALSGKACFFPMARSLSIKSPSPTGMSVQFLAKTTSRSFGETNLRNNEAEFNEEADKKGPLNIAVVARKNNPDSSGKKGALVVFGDSDFANNVYGGMQANSDMFLNVVNWLAEEEDLISIRTKPQEDRRVSLTPSQGKMVFYFSVIFLPLAVLVIGFAVFINRRKL